MEKHGIPTVSRHFYDNAWRWKCGLPEIEEQGSSPRVIMKDLRESEWSEEFEKLMRNRLIMGGLRYGRLNAPGKPKFELIDSMYKRIAKYQETGNKEYLVDVANICLVEFVEEHHPNAHFESIDDGEHIERSDCR